MKYNKKVEKTIYEETMKMIENVNERVIGWLYQELSFHNIEAINKCDSIDDIKPVLKEYLHVCQKAVLMDWEKKHKQLQQKYITVDFTD